MLSQVIAQYNEAVFDTDRDRALSVVREAVHNGLTPEEVVFEIVLPAMDMMAKAVTERHDANLAQHFITAQIAGMVTEEMVPKFKQAPEIRGRVVIGNSFGDLHGLGKRIVIGCLKVHMLDVIDLGTNVRAQTFVEEAIARNAQVIAISSMMVHTARGEEGPRKVRALLKERQLEGRIKIIVGGAPYRFDPNLYHTVLADAWSADAVGAGKVVEELLRGMQP